jgi:DNA primase
MYVAECSALLKVDEQVLISEINKIKRTKLGKETNTPKEDYLPLEDTFEPLPQDVLPNRMEYLERDIIRLLFEHAYEPFNEDGSIIDFLFAELESDHFEFTNEVYKEIIAEYRKAYDTHQQLDKNYFFTHANEQISKLAFELLNTPYELSENWIKKHGVIFSNKQDVINKDLLSIIFKLKIEIVNQKIKSFDEQMAQPLPDEEIAKIINLKQEYLKVKMEFAKTLGSVII